MLESISRVTVDGHHARAARRPRPGCAGCSPRTATCRELVEIGAYVPGTNADADAAIALMPQIDDFLRQDMDDSTALTDTWGRLDDLVATA